MLLQTKFTKIKLWSEITVLQEKGHPCYLLEAFTLHLRHLADGFYPV